jgi:tetratricopeptide (TPR) repeat protein
MDWAKKTRLTILLCALLSAVTLATFWPVVSHDFINYDDTAFVSQNPHVVTGLSWTNVRWALRTGLGGNWQPLTWLSHMLDAQFFGLKPGWHHLTSLVLHVASTVLLFLLLEGMTGAAWRSALVAALFALHPLHVESVAWLAERKDVLSAFFFMLTLWAYAGYVEGRRKNAECGIEESAPGAMVSGTRTTDHGPRTPHHVSRFTSHASSLYLLSLAFFALGLMSKPMLVTVPFVLLLLDYWPLRRMQNAECRMQNAETGTVRPSSGRRFQLSSPFILHPSFFIILEKLPFFALSAIACVVAFVTQRASGSVFPLAYLTLTERAANALVVCATYVQKAFWPAGLAVFYPMPDAWPVGMILLAGLVVLGITAWAIRFTQRSPHLIVGWLWFVGMLVPVIGLVQVGLQQMADRYTYLPLIGLFLMLVWEASEALNRWRIPRGIVGGVAGLVLLCCAVATRAQLRYWQNSEAVFRHAVTVTRNNWLAHYNLAETLGDLGRRDEAADEYRQALAIHPRFARAHNNLANLLLLRGQADEAISQWREALAIDPRLASAHDNLGNVLLGSGQVDEAIAHLEKAVALEPGLANAHNSLGNALLRKGRLTEAVAQFQEALRLRPNFPRAHCNLGAALLRQGYFAQGIAQYEAAVATQSPNPAVLNSVAWVLATCPEPSVRNGPRAVELAEQARHLTSGENPAVLGTLAAAYAEAGRFPEAVATVQRALELTAPQGSTPQAQVMRAQLRLYQAGTPFRDPGLVRTAGSSPRR